MPITTSNGGKKYPFEATSNKMIHILLLRLSTAYWTHFP